MVYELNIVKELPFENNDNGDFDKYFEYLDSSLPNPLETIQNSNLFEGGTASAIQNINLFDGGQASVKEGFQIKTEADKKDPRPLEEQLKLNTNRVLETEPKLKEKVTKLVKSYPDIWAFYGNNKSYGTTHDLEFRIELLDENTKPVKSKFRILNELQVRSLEAQVQEWVNNDIVSIHDVVPNDGWVSSFVPILKAHKGEKPTIRWCSDFRGLNEKTKPLVVPLPSVEDNLLLLANSQFLGAKAPLEIPRPVRNRESNS